MALVKPINLQHVHPSTRVYVALFTSVGNAAFLRSQLLAGNREFSYAFIDARSVISSAHLFAAVFRALNDNEAGRLKSNNVHSEVVFSLSPNNNIADSFRRFGIADDTKDLVVVKIYGSAGENISNSDQHDLEHITSHLTENVHGKPVPFTDAAIADTSDLDYIAKLYKISTSSGNRKQEVNSKIVGDKINGHESALETQIKKRNIESAALGAMALKGS